MREAYLVNNSQSITSIPLYEKVPVTIRGRDLLKTQFKKLVPTEEYVLGVDISMAKKKYYSQFKSIHIDLKFRDVTEGDKEDAGEDETIAASDNGSVNSQEGDSETGTNSGEDDEQNNQVELYTEEGLKKLRQADLIDIATKMGLTATKEDSKAEITKMILEKQNLG